MIEKFYFILVLLTSLSSCAEIQSLSSDGVLIDQPPTRSITRSPINYAVSEIMLEGVTEMHAEGGAAILMEAETGRIISLVSVITSRAPDWQEPLYNRAVLPAHELGSVFKTFTIAQALDMGLVTLESRIETPPSLRVSQYQIRDFENTSSELTVSEVFLRGSNVGTAQIAELIGGEAQQEFLGELGLLSDDRIQRYYPTLVRRRVPLNWTNLINATMSYGHGATVSPLDIAVAYSSLLNGGQSVEACTSFLRKSCVEIVGTQTSEALRALLRANVEDGVMSLAAVEGVAVGAYGGTADMLDENGGYDDGRVVATVAAAFPIDHPKYVLVVMLENPDVRIDGRESRTSGWTVAPLVSQIIGSVGTELL